MGLREVNAHDDRPLQEIADALARSHKVLLVTGAGISTSCGIPARSCPCLSRDLKLTVDQDFRSKDGLYNIIPEQSILPTPPSSQPSTPQHRRRAASLADGAEAGGSRRSSLSPSSKLKGQDLFDSRIFNDAVGTTIFYQFIASLRQKIHDEVKDTSATHKFVRVLRDGGRLMRCYTQNIDGLEAREGLVTSLSRGKGNKRRFMKKHYETPRPPHTQGTDFDGGCEVVQLHGDLDKLRCFICGTQYHWTDEETEIYLDGAAPSCHACKEKSEDRRANGKRGLAVGSLRPNIVLYGEEHPHNVALTPLIPYDASCQPETLVIMGTSLKVFGLQKIVREFAKAVHSHKQGRVIFVNRTRPAESVWDGIIDEFVAMDCDDWVEDLKKRRPDLWLRQGDIALSVTKPAPAKKKRKSAADLDETEQKKSKKQKVTVEVPTLAEAPQPTAPSTPSRKNILPALRKQAAANLLVASHGADRIPLSPLKNSRKPELFADLSSAKKTLSPDRPPFSPMTSPVRPDDDAAPVSLPRKGSPVRPAFSPITPGVLNSCKRKIEVYNEAADRKITYSETLDSEEQSGAMEPEDMVVPEQPTRKWFKGLSLFAQLSFFASGRGDEFYEKFSQETAEDQDSHETPSRGPGGRKVNALV